MADDKRVEGVDNAGFVACFRQADSGEGTHSSSGPGPAVSREEAAHLVVRGMRRA
jgi:hypothetical protein